MRKILAVLLVFAFISSGSAVSISQQDVIVDLADSSVNISMKVEDMSSSTFYYTSSFPVNNLEARVDGKEIECSQEPLPPGSYITCDIDKQNFTINLEYTTSGLVNTRNGVKIFRYTQSIQRPTRNYSIKVYLPSGSGLVQQSNVSLPVVSPSDGVTGSDGQRIYLKWEARPDLGQVSYQAIYRPVEDEGNRFPGILLAIIVAVAALILSAGYAYFSFREDLDQAYEDISEDEKDVLDMIRENNDAMLQKDIVDQSDYSKAKISSVISDLEEKGIINKTKEGRSNKVSISRKYKY